MRNIEKYVPPIENFCIASKVFTPEQCDQIIATGELFEFKKGAVGSGSHAREDMHIRDTDITWINPDPEHHWIFDYVHAAVSRVNFDKYQLDLSRFDGFQYSKYKVDGHYDWHVDTVNYAPDNLYRKLSCVVALTDPSEYEGGDLLLVDGGNAERPVRIRPNKGDMVVFYSYIPHKVEPVTKGNRMTLVTWAKGAKFK